MLVSSVFVNSLLFTLIMVPNASRWSSHPGEPVSHTMPLILFASIAGPPAAHLPPVHELL